MTWYEHDGVYYNLDKFTQIVRGEDTEILLCGLRYSGIWEDEKKHICVLKFKNREEREKDFVKIGKEISK